MPKDNENPPPRGGREQGGGERLDGHSEKTQETLFWDNQVFSNLEGVLETIREVLLTPHPDPLPCLRRSACPPQGFWRRGFAQAGQRGEGR